MSNKNSIENNGRASDQSQEQSIYSHLHLHHYQHLIEDWV